jgi:hypothetical protein
MRDWKGIGGGRREKEGERMDEGIRGGGGGA